MIRAFLIGVVAVFLMSSVPAAQAVATRPETAVDDIFAKWNSSTPGCAVGVAVGGKPVLLKAYGMADLEICDSRRSKYRSQRARADHHQLPRLAPDSLSTRRSV